MHVATYGSFPPFPAYRLSFSHVRTKYVHLLQNTWALQRTRAHFLSALENAKPFPRPHEIRTFISPSTRRR